MSKPAKKKSSTRRLPVEGVFLQLARQARGSIGSQYPLRSSGSSSCEKYVVPHGSNISFEEESVTPKPSLVTICPRGNMVILEELRPPSKPQRARTVTVPPPKPKPGTIKVVEQCSWYDPEPPPEPELEPEPEPEPEPPTCPECLDELARRQQQGSGMEIQEKRELHILVPQPTRAESRPPRTESRPLCATSVPRVSSSTRVVRLSQENVSDSRCPRCGACPSCGNNPQESGGQERW